MLGGRLGEGVGDAIRRVVIGRLGRGMRLFVTLVEMVSLLIQSRTASLRLWLNLNLPHIFWRMRFRRIRREGISMIMGGDGGERGCKTI